MKPRFFSGEGGGSIEFIPGNTDSPLVKPAPYEKPWPKEGKKIPKRGWAGRADNWGLYSLEMNLRAGEFRGRELDKVVADRMLQALYEGDSTYFDGLAETLKKFEKLEGNPTAEPRLQDVTAAIRAAAIAADGVPAQRDVFDCWAPGRGNLTLDQMQARDKGLWKKFRENQLVPIGFEWLPARGKGKPRKSP